MAPNATTNRPTYRHDVYATKVLAPEFTEFPDEGADRDTVGNDDGRGVGLVHVPNVRSAIAEVDGLSHAAVEPLLEVAREAKQPPLLPTDGNLLWFQRGPTSETFHPVDSRAPPTRVPMAVLDIAEGQLRSAWEIFPAYPPVRLDAAHVAGCARTRKRKPVSRGKPVCRLFVGQMRSQKPLQYFFLEVLSALSGAVLYDVECAKNLVRFSVLGYDDEARVLAMSKRLRCIGDSIVMSLDAGVCLNRIQVQHPTMLCGHAAPIERSKKKTN